MADEGRPLRFCPLGARQTLQLGRNPFRPHSAEGAGLGTKAELERDRSVITTTNVVGPCTFSIQSVSWPALATVADNATS